MKKNAYEQPVLTVIRIEHAQMICNSQTETIKPGEPNLPAGAQRTDGRNFWNDWDEEDFQED